MKKTDPEKFAIHLKEFVNKRLKPDLPPTNTDDLDFLVAESVVTFIVEILRMNEKNILQINIAEVFICEVFVFTAAKFMLSKLNICDSESKAMLITYCGTFGLKFGKEVIQRYKKAMRPVNHFYQQNPKTYNVTRVAITQYIEKPSYRRIRDLSDLFKLLVDHTIEVRKYDDDVVH